MSKMHLIKKEHPTNESISDETKSDAISFPFDLKSAIIDDKKSGTKNLNLPNQSFGLFRKYLGTNAQNNFGGKTNEEESEAIRGKAPSALLVPFQFSDNFRPPTLLERVLFPSVKENVNLPTLTGEKSSTAQLTIFYSGSINVYNNVSVDKAQAIMLQAGESSWSDNMVKNVTKVGTARPSQTSNLSSICKLQAELPIARKLSLQRFFKKRHDRIINKSPYAPPTRT